PGFPAPCNYTSHPPGPTPARPPGPPAPPSRLARLCAALADPALTGMPRQDLAALAAALQPPFLAAREQRLYPVRGGPRRARGWAARPSRGKLDLTAQLAVTLLRQRLSVPQRVLASALGVHRGTLSNAFQLTRDLLTAHGITITPAPARPR